MAFRCTKPTPHPVKTLAYEPWELAVEPFQVAPQTWYVAGQTWVGCYLIDTGDGLILIDTAIPESLYLLVDSIYRLGFKLTDIKKILLSHAHFDHCGAAGAMKKLTGAELYMSKEDTEFYKACPEETLVLDPDSHPQDFEVDKYYSDDEPITLGNVTIRTLLTPGHTVGCTSFLWEVKNPANGETYVVGMHGGVGANEQVAYLGMQSHRNGGGCSGDEAVHHHRDAQRCAAEHEARHGGQLRAAHLGQHVQRVGRVGPVTGDALPDEVGLAAQAFEQLIGLIFSLFVFNPEIRADGASVGVGGLR